jgi:penicillin-binding protein 1A
MDWSIRFPDAERGRALTRALPRWTRQRGFVASLGLSLAALSAAAVLLPGIPDVRQLGACRPGGGGVLLDRHGRAFAELAPIDRERVLLASLPRHVPDAFVAIEDRRFLRHSGVDVRRVLGALWANLRAGQLQEGASTISMQLARNAFPELLPARERTLGRKLLEARVALAIERRFSKHDILEMYLNHIYFGEGAHGLAAAARRYFGVRASELTLAQAALLAALPRSPAHYDPRQHPQAARARRNLVIAQMVEQRLIDGGAARTAQASELGVVERPPASNSQRRAAYFAEAVRRELDETLGEELLGQPLRITTTLDLGFQAAAEEELENQLRSIEAGGLGKSRGPRACAGPGPREACLQGAFVALEAGSGDVLAWVGGRSFGDSRFDHVRNARRQAGSAFKPFVFAAALEAGYSASARVSNAPLRLDVQGQPWEPRNHDGVYEEETTLREALVRSKNVATLRLAGEVGYPSVRLLALKAGFEPPIPAEPSMPLGTLSVSPLQLTAAYTSLANQGQAVRPRLVLEVRRADGSLLWQAAAVRGETVMRRDTAYLVTDMLRDVVTRGTGSAIRAAGFGGPAAGKTGTTNDGADAWFVGYTPEVVATVWIGFDEVRSIVPGATGGRLAAPVWARVLGRFYRDRPQPRAWSAPPGVVEVRVDPDTGLGLAPGCAVGEARARREVFRANAVPELSCPPPRLAEEPPDHGEFEEAWPEDAAPLWPPRRTRPRWRWLEGVR